jgi:hypothetical protein
MLMGAPLASGVPSVIMPDDKVELNAPRWVAMAVVQRRAEHVGVIEIRQCPI